MSAQSPSRVPPLGGIASYEEASRPGVTVERTVDLLTRCAFVKRRLMDVGLAHICPVAEWEVKCGLSLHCWLDAEHAAQLRERVAELREPPLHLDEVADEALDRALEVLLRADGVLELLAGIYRVFRPALVDGYRRHLDATNPLADHPTWRLLRFLIWEEEQMIEWGVAALDALAGEQDSGRIGAWEEHLRTCSVTTLGNPHATTLPSAAAPGRPEDRPFVLDKVPRRDSRFPEQWNVKTDRFVDMVALDDEAPAEERTVALIYKRLREMNVPEMMATLIAETPGKPWDYYREMTRQLWDEARHAMMGEVGFRALGIDWTSLSIPVDWSYVLNNYLDPIERHAMLYKIEQHLMRGDVGKRAEWAVSSLSGNELATMFQDYDWADEVLHSQIGRRWLLPEIGGRAGLETVIRRIDAKHNDAYRSDPLLQHGATDPWWPDFYLELQGTRARDYRQLIRRWRASPLDGGRSA